MVIIEQVQRLTASAIAGQTHHKNANGKANNQHNLSHSENANGDEEIHPDNDDNDVTLNEISVAETEWDTTFKQD